MKELRVTRSTMTMLLTALLVCNLTAATALSQSVTFAVVGDTGDEGKNQRAIAAQMNHYRNTKGKFEFVLLLGDNIYPDGVGDGLVKEFEVPFKDLIDAGVKFYAVLGNHDVTKEKGWNSQIAYPKFNMGGRCYYSMKMGDGLVEFFALDSTPLAEEKKTCKPKSEQLLWLDESLRTSTARWKVVFLHHAMFSSAYKRPWYRGGKGHGKDSGVLALRAMLKDKFMDNKVDVVFAGHDHVFEKTKPQVSTTGHTITYITAGAGSKLRKGDLDKKKSAFFEFGEDRKYSFLVVGLSDKKMDVDVVDSTGNNIFPRFSILKP